MAVVFADAGYFIARMDRRDSLHERAEALFRDLEPFEIVTTEMVLVEVLNHFSGAGENIKSIVTQLTLDMEENPDVEIVPQTHESFRAARDLYASRQDQTWSLTDCASFIAMEERGITEALAFDRDFEQAGYVALLRPA